ncbi:MAG: ATP-binding cassette domain-containing protein, partial [Brevundimonas sp.]
MTRVLEAQGIEKVFLNGDEETRVLKGIDLTLDKAELAALSGPSGSGKSTLLSIIGLLLRPTAGSLTISGERVD